MQRNPDSGLIREIFACKIRNPGKLCFWNPESRVLESGIQLKESRIPVMIGIKNPSSGIRIKESRILDCLGFPHMGWIAGLPSLTTLSWVSRFHDQPNALTSWQLISHAFLKSQTPKSLEFCSRGFVSKLDINRRPAQSKENAQRSRLITFFWPTAKAKSDMRLLMPSHWKSFH